MRISTHVISSVFTNCYFVQDEGTGRTVIIDPGEFTEEMREQVDRIGCDKIEYILLTHCHFDHVLGAAQLRDYTGAPVAIHNSEEKALGDPAVNGMRSFGITDGRLPKADILFKEGDIFEAGDLEFRVLHTPGHSAGSCCFICEDVIFAGDTLFRTSVGRTDLPTGDYGALLKSLKKLKALGRKYQVYPGHGGPTTIADELRSNPYYQELS